MPELLLPRLKREIQARLAELKPLVEEFEHLEAAKRALLEDLPVERRAPAAEPKARRSAAPVAPNGRPAAEPEPVAAAEPEPVDPDRQAILAIVDERPGVSVAEIVAVTKLDKSLVASKVSALKRAGVLADEAGGVKLASRQPVTLEAMAGGGRDQGVDDAAWEAARPKKRTRAAAV
jgi:hypothetical protein